MAGKIDTALVLAAGLGSRMRPLTLARPKPLIEAAGRTLLDHALDRLVEAGVSRAVVNVHYLADQLVAHVRARRGHPDIQISDERDQLLETGGAGVKARALFGDCPIFISNTDQVWIEDQEGALSKMAAMFDPIAMDCLLLLAPRVRTTGFSGPGDFFLSADGRIGRRGRAEIAPFVYAGVQIVRPQLFDGREEAPFSFNRIWDERLGMARVFAMVLQGDWLHVGDPEGLAEANARLTAG